MSFAIDVAPHVSTVHCVVGLVCVAGVMMAYWSDEDHARDFAQKILGSDSRCEKKSQNKDKQSRIPTPSAFTSLCNSLAAVQKSLQQGTIVYDFLSWATSWVQFFQFVWTFRSLKSAANSRRQYVYLMEKQILGIPIKKAETEVNSYLDLKRHMGKNWPFMWEVSEVKDAKIECDGFNCVPFSSYSYLDLVRNQEVQEAAIAAARLYSTGNHGPRMLGGNMRILVELEKQIAEFFGRDGTLLCASGFLACMSVACAIASEGDVIFADSRCHASLRSGLKLCGAKIVNFKHNDYGHLEKLLKKHRRKFNGGWIMIESVYSMDGDIADLPAAHALARKHNLRIILDEAHGLGVVGKTGRGLEEHFDMPGVCTIICGTFSKSIASIGGYITGPKDLIDFMDFHAPGNVFSAPLPAYCAGAAIKAFELIDRESWRVKKAQENAAYLRHALATGLGHWPADYPEDRKYELEGDPATTVIPIVFPDDINRCMRIASHLKKRGFMLAAVAFPACPLRRPRFRVTGTAAYDKALMNRFIKELVTATVDEPPSESSLQLKNL
eukprot:Lankesteria_metandrocarpae@DN5097_c0_g1_i1.p2